MVVADLTGYRAWQSEVLRSGPQDGDPAHRSPPGSNVRAKELTAARSAI
jgi:hypothetical protein